MKKLLDHLLASIDGKKVPPKWLHRSRHIAHLIYYGSVALGGYWIHERIVGVVFVLELASVALGRDNLRDAVIEFE